MNVNPIHSTPVQGIVRLSNDALQASSLSETTCILCNSLSTEELLLHAILPSIFRLCLLISAASVLVPGTPTLHDLCCRKRLLCI